VGVLAAAWLADYEARRRKLSREVIWDSLAWLLIAGIIGARIWHILTPPPSMVVQGITTSYYFTHPLDALAVWNGGLGIPGRLLGCAGFVYLYPFAPFELLQWSDIIIPGVLLAQAIGRGGIISTRNYTGLLRICPGQLPLISTTACLVIWNILPITHYFYMSHCWI